MVCWADNVDWRSLLGKLGIKVTEEDKSNAIWELEEEKGHDYLKSLSDKEIEQLLLEKLREKYGENKDEDDDEEKDEKNKKKKKQVQMYI